MPTSFQARSAYKYDNKLRETCLIYYKIHNLVPNVINNLHGSKYKFRNHFRWNNMSSRQQKKWELNKISYILLSLCAKGETHVRSQTFHEPVRSHSGLGLDQLERSRTMWTASKSQNTLKWIREETRQLMCQNYRTHVY